MIELFAILMMCFIAFGTPGFLTWLIRQTIEITELERKIQYHKRHIDEITIR
jgi:hypothetical protein